MKNCPYCSFENIDSAKHCINCGARLDGNLYCPKCHEVVGVNDTHCPKCGVKLPSKSEENTSPEAKQIESKKEKVDVVFNQIFYIASIVVFFVAISLSVSNFFSLRIVDKDYTYNLVSLIRGFFEDDNSIELYARVSILSICVVNIGITLAAAIHGLIKSFKTRKVRPFKCNTYWELGVVLASNCVAAFLIPMFLICDNSISYSSGQLVHCVSVLLSFVALMMIYFTYRSFSKNRPLKFVEKIIFSLIVYLSIGVIIAIGLPFYIFNAGTDNYLYEGNIHFLVNVIDSLKFVSGDLKNEWIVLVVLTGIYTLSLILIVITMASIIPYVISIFFTPLENKKAPKVPLMFAGIFVNVLAIINLGISIFVLNKYAPNVGVSSYLPVSSIVVLAISLVLFAVILVSLNITRKLLRQDKLIASKEKIEELSNNK